MKAKVLIVSRGVWDDTKGTSSTLTNLFEDYDSNQLAHIYIETIPPNTKCCFRFFQISEFALVHKIFKWRTKTGHLINTHTGEGLFPNKQIARQEASTMRFVRSHRSIWFSLAREILWGFNGWKTNELKQFIKDFNPDVIWLDGSPLPLMNRLYHYIMKITNKPAAIFIQDDVYTYESCPKKITSLMYKWYLRKMVKRVISQCNEMFVISSKMKREYDEIFGLNSIVITKSFKTERIKQLSFSAHKPLRMVYLGQVLYGRIYTLMDVASMLREINAKEEFIHLSIYTNNIISPEQKKVLTEGGYVDIKPPVPYTEVAKIIEVNDIVLFVESFESQYNKVARLSFSTKICDYLACNKCIFAVGPSNIAPIEYFLEEDAAIVAVSRQEIKDKLLFLIEGNAIEEYASKARASLIKNHNREKMNKTIYGKLNHLAQNNHKL